MARYLIKRTLLGVSVLFAVSVLSFLMFFALPRDPVTGMCPKNCNAERLERVRTELGLNDPKLEQYANYMKGIFTGRDLGTAQGGHCDAPCLGYSYVNSEAVSDTFARVLPVTLSIVLPAAVLWLALGVGLGMVSALKRGSVLDRVSIGFSLTFASLQLYFVGAVLLLVFVYQLRVLPNPGYTSILDNPWQWARGLVLAWVTLALLFSAIYARLSRAQMLETLSEDFIRTARAKGLPERAVVVRHALRGAVVPVVTYVGIAFGTLLGGAVVTEVIFDWDGIGSALLTAIQAQDNPVVLGAATWGVVVFVVVNLVVDVICGVLDPRTRLR